jgi:hypothetical protein
MTHVYVFLGGPRDGDTVTTEEHPISSWATRDGRYLVDDPPQRTGTDKGPAVILRYVERPAR